MVVGEAEGYGRATIVAIAWWAGRARRRRGAGGRSRRRFMYAAGALTECDEHYMNIKLGKRATEGAGVAGGGPAGRRRGR